MRSSLLVLAIVLASLHLVRGALARRRRESFAPSGGGSRLTALVDASAFSLGDGSVVRSGPSEMGRKRLAKGTAAKGDAASSRFADWRYYGFSSHGSEADAAVAKEASVAASPAVGSVVSSLPDGCINVVVDGGVYWHCGSVWYQLQYTGSDVSYVVVHAP